MEASDLRRMKYLEEENARLKRMYADLCLTHDATKDFIKKGLVMQQRREAMSDLVGQGVSVQSACDAVGLSRASFYRRPMDWRERHASVIEAIQGALEERRHDSGSGRSTPACG